MFELLQDILIITKIGNVLISKIKNPQIEKDLLGKLVSALDTFCEDLSNEELRQFEFSNLRFDLIKRNDIIFLGSSSKDVKHKKVVKVLRYIIDLFFERFPEDYLNNWDGNIDLFRELEEYITKTRDEMIIELLFKQK